MLVHEFLKTSGKRLPDKTAIICGQQKITYRELNEASDRLAASMIASGIDHQDRVIIFLDNSIESVISLFGILKAGCIFIMLNATMKSKKVNYILRNSGARLLITHFSKLKIVKEAIQDAPDLEYIYWNKKDNQTDDIHFDDVGLNDKKSINWSTAISPDSVNTIKYPRIIDHDLATIIYTSGSTGEPKGVVSAHYNVVAAVKSITTYLENVENDIILCALPLSFDYGLYQILMSFYFGGTVILEKSFTYPVKIIERLKAENVTGFPIVPTMVSLLLKLENLLSEYDLSTLRYISNTAAALPTPHIKKLRKIFPNIQIYSMYGLTECKRVSYLPPEFIDSKPDSVGIPMPNLDISIVNSKGEDVGVGEVGELVIRGATVMQGYWKAPDVTSQVFRQGRFRSDTLLYSGDLFKRDDKGFLYFVSRKDDLIKTKGERVSPKEIENALSEIDDVLQCAVIGVPDEVSGNVIKAFIMKKENSQLTEKQVIRICTANLEPFMVPKHIEFVDSFPSSSSGKIDKKMLR